MHCFYLCVCRWGRAATPRVCVFVCVCVCVCAGVAGLCVSVYTCVFSRGVFCVYLLIDLDGF